MHRLRDLDRRRRLVAAGIALLIVLVPLIAAAVNHGRWEPQGDDALIELRARDVGTDRNPVVGQPSTSGTYGEKADNVAHPGPLGFQVLAPSTRLLGPVTGTLLAAAAVSAISMLTVVWLVYRELGPRGGAAAAALVALAAFSAGAAGLTDPLSSNFGRMPLLAAAVGVWAIACGDLRIAPLTVAFWSFAAQQHLSVLPAAAVLGGAGLVAAAFWVWRAGAGERLRSLAWVAGGAVVGLVLWSPVLYQQLTGDPGNLTALSRYSGDSARRDVGIHSAADQVANALGPWPFLGRSSPEGWDLVAGRSAAGLVLTFAIVGLLLVVGAWWRRREPKLLAAIAMIGVLLVAAVITGTNIPDSGEQGRLNFFHWAFALSFFELLVFLWLLVRLIEEKLPQPAQRRFASARTATACSLAAVVILGVAVTPLVVERESDRLYQPIAAPAVRDLLDQLEASEELDAVDGPLLVLVNGSDAFVQVGDTVGARLAVGGTPIQFPPGSAGFVHPDRIADPCTVQHALVISLMGPDVAVPPGEELAAVDAAPTLDHEALDRLIAQAQGKGVVLGPDMEAALTAMGADEGALIGSTIAFRLGFEPLDILLARSNLDLLIDHPVAEPALDRDDLIALRDSLPEDVGAVVATEVTAHLLDREQLEAYRPKLVADC